MSYFFRSYLFLELHSEVASIQLYVLIYLSLCWITFVLSRGWPLLSSEATLAIDEIYFENLYIFVKQTYVIVLLFYDHGRYMLQLNYRFSICYTISCTDFRISSSFNSLLILSSMRQPAPDIWSTAQESECSYKKRSSAESDVTLLSYILIGRRFVKQNREFLK